MLSFDEELGRVNAPEELAGFDHPLVRSEQVSGKAEYALSVIDHTSDSTLTPAQTLGIQFSHALK